MASDIERVDFLLYKLTVLNFPSKLVKTVSFYFSSRTFEASFQIATSTCCQIKSGRTEGGIISPVLFKLYVNDMPCLPAIWS